MYDLKTDPLERTNLAFKDYKRNALQSANRNASVASSPRSNSRACSL